MPGQMACLRGIARLRRRCCAFKVKKMKPVGPHLKLPRAVVQPSAGLTLRAHAFMQLSAAQRQILPCEHLRRTHRSQPVFLRTISILFQMPALLQC